MSGSVKGTAVSYYHRSLQGAIHRRQAVKPCAERLQLFQMLQGWFVSLTYPGKAQRRAVTLYNQGRGRSHAEEAMCYLESLQSHHHFTVPDNTQLFKFITGNVMQFVLGGKLDGTLSWTLNRMLKPSQKPLSGSCHRDTNQPNQLLFFHRFWLDHNQP